ncbi:MAG: protease Do, partial [Rhodocyclaceae bacterium]|nr:protease Do [Rhodocyclaceae bacterium]
MKRFLALISFLVFIPLAQAQGQFLPDFSELAEKQGPAVVNISTTQTARGGANQMMPFPFDENDPEFEFFKRFIPRQPGGNGRQREFEN